MVKNVDHRCAGTVELGERLSDWSDINQETMESSSNQAKDARCAGSTKSYADRKRMPMEYEVVLAKGLDSCYKTGNFPKSLSRVPSYLLHGLI
ncbi:hypothetical protein Tco_0852128 [Tanacetum coccineum]